MGASREMVQRLLKELRSAEAVTTGRRALLIMRPDVLRRIARSEQPPGPRRPAVLLLRCPRPVPQ